MTTKKCPYCAEEIKAEAIKCKHCKKDISIQKETPEATTPPAPPKPSKEPKDNNYVSVGIESVIFWIFVVVFYIILLSISPVISFLVAFPFIWYVAPKKEALKERAVATLLVLLLIIPGVIDNYQEWRQDKEEAVLAQEREEAIAQYPDPQIELLSSEGSQGSSKEYLLEFTVTDADIVFVDGIGMTSGTGEVFSSLISLDDLSTNILIRAENEYRYDELKVTITRDKTLEEEEEERLAKEAEESAKEEKASETATDSTKPTALEEEIYDALYGKLDSIYDNPSLSYILVDDSLLEQWDQQQVDTIVEQYGLADENELNDILAKVFSWRFDY